MPESGQPFRVWRPDGRLGKPLHPARPWKETLFAGKADIGGGRMAAQGTP